MIDPVLTGDMTLAEEEQYFEELFKDAQYVSSGPEFENWKKMMQETAKNTIAKRERQAISLKIPRGELEKFKKNSASEGLKYQTKLNQLIHLYNAGKISVVA